MKIVVFLVAVFSYMSVYSIDLSVVSEDVCLKRGSKIWRCDQLEVTLPVNNLEAYIPLESTLNVSKNTFCNTAYPIYLDVYAGQEQLQTVNVFSVNRVAYDQFSFVDFNVRVNAPYANIATFDSRCEITATVNSDSVNRPKLRVNLTDLKGSAENELHLVDALISKQALIIDLAAVVDVYEEVLDLAELTLTDFYELNELLVEACFGDPDCTWSSQVEVIIDNNPAMDFQSQLLLFFLAQELDALVPSDCTSGNCVANLIDSQTQTVLEDIAQRTPSEDAARAELEEYHVQRSSLSNLLVEYRAVAYEYDIDWEEL